MVGGGSRVWGTGSLLLDGERGDWKTMGQPLRRSPRRPSRSGSATAAVRSISLPTSHSSIDWIVDERREKRLAGDGG